MTQECCNTESCKRVSEVVKDLIEGNCLFADKHCEMYSSLKDKQTPDVTMITCSDSRVPEASTCNTLNKVFTIKNIGNQYRTAPGSVHYGVLHLNTPVLLVLGHTGCGAIAASLSNYSNEDPSIKKEIDTLQEPMQRALSKFGDPGSDVAKQARFSEENVDYQVETAMDYPQISQLVSDGKLHIIGAVLDIHCIYSKTQARLHIINVNGEKDQNKIKDIITGFSAKDEDPTDSVPENEQESEDTYDISAQENESKEDL